MLLRLLHLCLNRYRHAICHTGYTFNVTGIEPRTSSPLCRHSSLSHVLLLFPNAIRDSGPHFAVDIDDVHGAIGDECHLVLFANDCHATLQEPRVVFVHQDSISLVGSFGVNSRVTVLINIPSLGRPPYPLFVFIISRIFIKPHGAAVAEFELMQSFN